MKIASQSVILAVFVCSCGDYKIVRKDQASIAEADVGTFTSFSSGPMSPYFEFSVEGEKQPADSKDYSPQGPSTSYGDTIVFLTCLESSYDPSVDTSFGFIEMKLEQVDEAHSKLAFLYQRKMAVKCAGKTRFEAVGLTQNVKYQLMFKLFDKEGTLLREGLSRPFTANFMSSSGEAVPPEKIDIAL